ncbi:MAG: cytochrome c [Cyclobacteriaceae bacterium]|nr:cytochrome c [Cyclobacteriaceae bacterium]
MKTSVNLVVIVAFTSLLFFSFRGLDQDDKWKAPAAEAKKVNPVKYDSEAQSIGKSLYAKHCKSCHGKEGLGDGTKAAELDTYPGDFTTDEVHGQTDGSLFYKISVGKDEMPGFDKKIPSEEDRWILVHYMRTLK